MPSQNKVLVVFGSHDFEFEDVMVIGWNIKPSG